MVKELSKIARGVHASTTMAIDSLFKQMKAEGQDVIGFAAGEPDFPTPEHIKEAAFQAIRENFTRYTPASGTLELKQAICARVKTDCGVSYTTNQVVVASGAKHVVYLALRALVDPGDEIILPTPAWVSYYELIRMVGGTPVVIHASEAEQFKLSPEKLERAITPRTKAIILNNPSNPTGMVYDAEQLRALAEVCVRHDLYIVVDEIYCSLVYDGKLFTSVASLGEEIKRHVILINGVSKSYAMTGWRIGYGLAEPEIAKVMSNYVSHSTGSPCAVSQKASFTALTAPQDQVHSMRDAFQARRDYMVTRMNSIPGVSCIRPEGAFYVMMNIEKLLGRTLGGTEIRDAEDFATAFLKQGLVAVVPGDGFGAQGFVRWSYAASMENIKEGLDRLERFLAQ
ncbi:MAG: pyridoxal phosphate-dependent aminotransferase [Pseudoflavonifractor sp.]|nr:pyridoxal phosphate-dependent aminotransferase [Pseudoflavonifractor sp.]